MTDGTISNKPYLAANGSINGLADVSAIIVGLGILDSTSRKIVSKTTEMIAALPDSKDGEAIATTWTAGDYLTQSGVPRAAASQLRIYQRYFYLKK